MSKSLVLGLGNPLAGADAFGHAVVKALRDSVEPPAGVDIIDANTDLLLYIDRFVERERVVLVDAVLADPDGVEGGPWPDPEHNRVGIFEEEVFSTWNDRSSGAHELSPLMAVKLFRLMHAFDPHAGLPAISLVAYLVREEEFGEPPGPDVIAEGTAAVRRAVGTARPIEQTHF
jgi:hypothetical protein